MRSSILLASGLAASAVAMPHMDARALKTRIKTEIAYATVTVVVTVTRSSRPATATSPLLSPVGQLPVHTSSPLPGSQPSGIAAPAASSLLSSTAVSIPPIIVSTPSGAATNAPIAASSSPVVVIPSSASIVSVAASPSSSVVVPTSSVPAASSSAAPYYQDHISGPSQTHLSSGIDYQNAVLYHHNAARANHNAAPLVWDTTCEANALTTAQMCVFAHSIPAGVSEGQNLFTVSGTVFNVTAGITESWYKSEFPSMLPYFGDASIPDDVFHSVGHLTQVLWKSTTGVGCVSYDCGHNMVVNGQPSTLNKFTVCNYSPPGNIATLYADNVGDPISTTNLGSWQD